MSGMWRRHRHRPALRRPGRSPKTHLASAHRDVRLHARGPRLEARAAEALSHSRSLCVCSGSTRPASPSATGPPRWPPAGSCTGRRARARARSDAPPPALSRSRRSQRLWCRSSTCAPPLTNPWGPRRRPSRGARGWRPSGNLAARGRSTTAACPPTTHGPNSSRPPSSRTAPSLPEGRHNLPRRSRPGRTVCRRNTPRLRCTCPPSNGTRRCFSARAARGCTPGTRTRPWPARPPAPRRRRPRPVTRQGEETPLVRARPHGRRAPRRAPRCVG
mmetsp:Transcript_12538/g.35970  ORF Transcript_12538/g.35970 Transcript_12538/m.35970 type:complete len:274 (-) Transcript_12538:76-897(-)